VCFTGPCNNHDVCYGLKGVAKKACDQQFMADLCRACETAFPGILEFPYYIRCKARAAIYFDAVCLGGGSAYTAAQKSVCDCLRGLSGFEPIAPGFILNYPSEEEPLYVDADGDFMDDAWELANGLDPTDPNDAVLDYDNDRLVNFGEFLTLFDPRNPDSNNNGIPDGKEVRDLQPPPPPILDATWSVTVNGQTAPITPSGFFHVANVPAGSTFIRVDGSSQRTDGSTLYVFSDYFQLANGQTLFLEDMTVTSTPPPSVARLSLAASNAILSSIGQTTPVTTLALFNDGTTRDVTARTEWTTYRTSNPSVATVGPNGLVTARGAGTALVTAVNDGVSAVTRISVLLGSTTRVEGFVEFADGTPAVGADVSIPQLSRTVQSTAGGRFAIDNVPGTLASFVVTAAITLPTGSLFGLSRLLEPVPGGVTDAGIIEVGEACGFDPSFGTDQGFDDDTVREIVFGQGFTFPFAGRSQDRVWVSANGNLQFGGSGDKTYNPAIPGGVVDGPGRISPAFVDFAPGAGGGVYVRQDPDRFLVTWFRVPLYGHRGSSNTLQLHLLADGSIRMAFNGMSADGTQRGAEGELMDVSVAVSPGGQPVVQSLDLSASRHQLSAALAGLENFTPQNRFDLDRGCLEWRPIGTSYIVTFHRPSSFAPIAYGVVTGTVCDAAGRPLPLRLVRVRAGGPEPIEKWIESDEAGRFRVGGVPPLGEVEAIAFDVGGQAAIGEGFGSFRSTRRNLDIRVLPVGRAHK
jgi:hypothetical protein